MPHSMLNGIRIYWERHGEGAPVVLVHGSWGDHHNWDLVAPALARSFRTLTYDRRGHSQSERPEGQGSIREDVADLASLIEEQHAAPAHVVGNSFGGSIVLALALARPDLFASLAVHEPPLVALLEGDPNLPAIRERMEAVIATLRSGDAARGAQQFVETVALGPGMWETLPPEMQRTFVFNAPTWVDEMMEPAAFWLDLPRLSTFPRPALISGGDGSPPFFGGVLDRIEAALPQARRHTFHGAGHAPHVTHADEFVRVVGGFIRATAAAPS